MILRPIFPESRTRSFCAAVALMFVLVALLLAAGCSGDCPDVLHTATMTKLDSYGNVTWIKVLDTGLSTTISGMVPTSDGGFVTAGSVATTHSYCTLNYQARVIRFTSTGEILWDRVFTSGEGNVWEIIRMHDGGFAALIDGSEIYRLDPEGRTVWNRSTGYASLYGSRSVIGETGDGGLVVAGPVFVKFDSDGNILWQRSGINESDWGFFSIIELGSDQGYIIFSSENINEIRKLHFDLNGNFLNSSEIITDGELTGYHLFPVTDGYRLVYTENKMNTTILHLNPEGIANEKKKIHMRYPFILTSDEGYFSTEKIDVLLEPMKLNPDGTMNKSAPILRGTEIQAIKLNPDGTRSWNSTIPNANLRNLRIIQVIQTTDGGFVIASDNGVQKDVSMLEQA